MTDMTEWIDTLPTDAVLTKAQRRASIELIDRQQSLFNDKRMMDDPYILDWIEKGASEPGFATFDKPEFGL